MTQVHRKGDFGDEVDGMKGVAVELLNGDDGRPKRRALWFSQDSRSQMCQRPVLLRGFPVRWVSSRSEDGRPRCFSGARSMGCVLLVFPL